MAKLMIELGARIDGLTRGLAQAKSKLKSFSGFGGKTVIDNASQKSLDMLSGKAGTAGKSLMSMGTLAAGGAALVAAGTAKMVASTIQAADAVFEGAQRVRSTAEEYQKLSQFAEKSGTDMGVLEGNMTRLNNVIQKAGVEGSSSEKKLSKLGLSFAELSKASGAEQMNIVVERLGKITNESERAGAAAELFGSRGAAAMLPLINSWGELQNEVATFSDAQAVAADKFGDGLKDLNKQVQGFLAPLIPMFASLIEWMNRLGTTAKSVASELAGGISTAFDVITGQGADRLNPNGIVTEGTTPEAKQRQLNKDEKAAKAVSDTAAAKVVADKAAAEQKVITDKATVETNRKIAAEEAGNARVVGKFQDLQLEIKLQTMLNAGKLKQAAIERELAAAEKAHGAPLDPVDKEVLAKREGELWDLRKIGAEQAAAANAKNPLAAAVQPAMEDRTNAVRRIGGTFGGNASDAQIPVLQTISDSLKRIDAKTISPLPGAATKVGVWP